MPIMDGYRATELIRAQFSQSDLPIIAITASTVAEDIQRALDFGMNDYISKPVDRELMKDKINLSVYMARKFKSNSPSVKVATEPKKGSSIVNEIKTLQLKDEDPKILLQMSEQMTKEYEELGVEFAKTNKRLGGQISFYFKLLVKFKESQTPKVLEISKMIDDKNYEALAKALHALKGVCLSLGMQRVGDLLDTFENNWVDGYANIRSDYENLLLYFNNINNLTEKYRKTIE